MQPQHFHQQANFDYQKSDINYGKSPYLLSSPYKLSQSSINSQANQANYQYQSSVRNLQMPVQEQYPFQQQMQLNQGMMGSQYQPNIQQQMSFNVSVQPSTNYHSPVKNDFVLFQRQDPYQRYSTSSNPILNNNNLQQQQLLGSTQLQVNQPNYYPIATLNTNSIGSQNRLNTQLSDTNQNRTNRYNYETKHTDTQSVNSALYSKQTDQDRSVYGYQVNRSRQFLSPDQQSVKSGRKKIFSPVSDRTITSLESEINSFSRFRQNGVSNRFTNSQYGQNQMNNSNRLSMQQYSSPQPSNQIINNQNRLYQSQSEKKRIFSPAMDYSKLSPLTKNPAKIEEEIYSGDNQYTTSVKGITRDQQNYQRHHQQEDEFQSPKFQDFNNNVDDPFNQSDDLAEKFYDSQNDKDQSSYLSFNHQNQSYENLQNQLEFERTKEQISPEKNSALKYLQEERVKRQLDGEFKKKQEQEQILSNRRKLFFQGIGGLVALIILTKFFLIMASYFR